MIANSKTVQKIILLGKKLKADAFIARFIRIETIWQCDLTRKNNFATAALYEGIKAFVFFRSVFLVQVKETFYLYNLCIYILGTNEEDCQDGIEDEKDMEQYKQIDESMLKCELVSLCFWNSQCW